ncbi:MFS transporter [Effusibacillus consociatus]|uniref:MFS transporter n=1 Tax=Effusibacillus consociatus TaxID=1117041 RepID=A0ABV9PXQ8_9BACL
MGDLVRLRSNRNYMIIMVAETLSNTGLWFGILANLHFLELHVPSNFLKSLILVAGPILGILVSPKAGVVIDRRSKKSVMMAGSLVQLASAIVMIGAMSLESVPMMVAGLLIASIGNSFYIPVLRSVIPLVVDKSSLVQANAVYTNVVTITRIAATAIAGWLLTVLPLYGMYWAALGIYLVMTGLRYMLLFEEHPTPLEKKSRDQISFLQVFPLLRSHPALMVLVGASTLVFLFLGGFNLLILKFSEFQQDPALKGWLYTIEGIGVLIGGFVVRRWFAGGNLLRRNVALLSGIAASAYILHFAAQRWAVVCGFALFGLMIGCWLPTSGAIPQLIVPEGIRGRYFAFQEMWNRTVFQLALLLTGGMLDIAGLPGYMIILAGTILTGFLVMFGWIVSYKLHVEAPKSQKSVAA